MNTDDISRRRFVHTRWIDATPAQVFAALAQPERLARWWGPEAFTSSFETFEFWPGGNWRFVMHGPDGRHYPNANVFRVVEAPHRVEIEHLDDAHHFMLRITFSPEGRGTRIGWEQTFDTVQHADQVAPWVTPANEQNLDRLQAEVAATRA